MRWPPERIGTTRGIIASLVCPMQAVMPWEDVWRALNGRFLVGQKAAAPALDPGAWLRAQPHPLQPALRARCNSGSCVEFELAIQAGRCMCGHVEQWSIWCRHLGTATGV